MNKFQRLKSFLNWQKQEHLKDTTTLGLYNQLSVNSKYDEIVDFDVRSKSFENLLANIDVENKRILDLACGSGAFIARVLRHKPAEIIGVDLSDGMLKLAHNRFKDCKNVRLINSSFMDVSFEANSIDLIVMTNASRYIPVGKEDLFFSNVHKWLKPDGIFIVHSDFWGGGFGRLVAPLILRFTNNYHVNPNTTFDWTLEKELRKYFEVFNKKKLQGSVGYANHVIFFCKNRSRCR